jgi:hypothetical protein
MLRLLLTMPIKRLMPTIAINAQVEVRRHQKEGAQARPGGSQERRQATDRIFREQKQARSFRLKKLQAQEASG